MYNPIQLNIDQVHHQECYINDHVAIGYRSKIAEVYYKVKFIRVFVFQLVLRTESGTNQNRLKQKFIVTSTFPTQIIIVIIIIHRHHPVLVSVLKILKDLRLDYG